MDHDLPRFQKSLVMIILSNVVEQGMEVPAISPESLLRFIQTKQRYIAKAFRQMSHVNVQSDMHFTQAIWRLEKDCGYTILEAIRTFLALTENCNVFNQWAVAEDLPECRVHAGIDIGQLVVDGHVTMGEVITSATKFAEEARKQQLSLAITAECYDYFGTNLKNVAKPRQIDVTAVVRRNRDIVLLSLKDAESLVATVT